MKLDKSIAVLAMVASLVLAAGTAAAQNAPAEADVDDQSVLDELDFTSSDTVTTDGGNVTNANLSTQQSTDEFAGIYGQTDGSLVLGSNTNDDVLYNWSATADYVFASNGSVEWSNLSDSNASNVDNYFGIPDGADDAGQTYDEPGTENIVLNGETLNGDHALTYNSTGEGDWSTVVLEDNSSATGQPDLPVFAGIVGEGSDAFNGDAADYQLIVPASDGTTTSYNMYLELS